MNRQIFAGKENCPIKNWTKTVESDLNQDKKARTLLWREKEANIYKSKYVAHRNPVMASNRLQIAVK